MHCLNCHIVSHRRRFYPDEGFTLWELLLVLSLLSFFLYLLVPHFGSTVEPLKQKVDQANVERIEGAAQLYRLDVGLYPVAVQALIEQPSGVSAWRGPYLKEWPVNPWNPVQAYQMDALGKVKPRN
ncbi:MAG: type II secretion system protein GspG [Desulfitobacteriaceae bacterium]